MKKPTRKRRGSGGVKKQAPRKTENGILLDEGIGCPFCEIILTGKNSRVKEYGLSTNEETYWYKRVCPSCNNYVRTYSDILFRRVSPPEEVEEPVEEEVAEEVKEEVPVVKKKLKLKKKAG